MIYKCPNCRAELMVEIALAADAEAIERRREWTDAEQAALLREATNGEEVEP